jgi:hypothetical protein
MARNLSQFISILFHPLFLPLYATWILLNSGNYLTYAVPDKFQQYLYLVIFISTALLPASLTWMMWQKGWITSMEMENRKERSLPYLITLSCYVATAYLLFRLPLPRLFALTIVGAGIAILLAFLINLRWKISIHMIGIGGLMGLFYGYGKFFHMKVLNITILMAIVAGIIAAARLYRSSHTPSQVYAGFIAGFSIELGVLYYLQY